MPTTALDDQVRVLLRREVGLLRARETRRRFDASVHVGVIGGDGDSFVVRAQDEPAVDDALRIDVVSGLLEDSPETWDTAWLVRPGAPHPHDVDTRWFAAAQVAFGMHGRALAAYVVVTRSGWRDVTTGETRVWKRLRLTSE